MNYYPPIFAKDEIEKTEYCNEKNVKGNRMVNKETNNKIKEVRQKHKWVRERKTKRWRKTKIMEYSLSHQVDRKY
jgi:hypothetical protein